MHIIIIAVYFLTLSPLQTLTLMTVPPGCFTGEEEIITAEYGRQKFSQIPVNGQSLLSLSTTGSLNRTIQYSALESWIHFEQDSKLLFLFIQLEDLHSLHITEEHLIYKHGYEDVMTLTTASNVHMGDFLYVRYSDSLEKKKVVNITRRWGLGAYAPLTKSRNLFVNDILVSSFTHVENLVLQEIILKYADFIICFIEWAMPCTKLSENHENVTYDLHTARMIWSTSEKMECSDQCIPSPGLAVTTVRDPPEIDCHKVCENQLYEVPTIDGWLLRSVDSNMLWYVKLIDDYPTIVLMNYLSHAMVELNWQSMALKETHNCTVMTLIKLEEHPTSRGCFILASWHDDTFFVLQRGGKLRAVRGPLTNELLNVQDLRCFNVKQTLLDPWYADICDFEPHRSDNEVSINSKPTPISTLMSRITASLSHDDESESKLPMTPERNVQWTVAKFTGRATRNRRKFTRYHNAVVTGTHNVYATKGSGMTGQVPRETSIKKMGETLTNTTIKSAGRILKEFNTTVMQENTKSSPGSTVNPSVSAFNKENYIASGLPFSVTMKLQRAQSPQLYANSTIATVRKVKVKTTKPVIFHYNTKYLQEALGVTVDPTRVGQCLWGQCSSYIASSIFEPLKSSEE